MGPIGKRVAAVKALRPTRATNFSPMAFHRVLKSLDGMLSHNSINGFVIEPVGIL
jgi:hypothetical protein